MVPFVVVVLDPLAEPGFEFRRQVVIIWVNSIEKGIKAKIELGQKEGKRPLLEYSNKESITNQDGAMPFDLYFPGYHGFKTEKDQRLDCGIEGNVEVGNESYYMDSTCLSR